MQRDAIFWRAMFSLYSAAVGVLLFCGYPQRAAHADGQHDTDRIVRALERIASALENQKCR